MKVCAHMNLGPHVHDYVTAASINDALRCFRRRLEQHYGVIDKTIAEIRHPDEMPALDLYPACAEESHRDGMHCNSQMNFHDWPMTRFQVGPRGGIRRVTP